MSRPSSSSPHTRTARPGLRARPTRSLTSIGLVTGAAALLVACAGSPAAPADSTAAAPVVSRPAAPEGDLPDALQAELQQVIDSTMAEYAVPGSAVGVWIPGQGSWTSATGLADIATGTPPTTEMSWPLRSITKSYTVTLILQLVDEGALSLDDTIDQYVDGVTNGDTITLRQLADMSSGNADYTVAAFGAEVEADPTRIFTLDELNAFVLDQPAQFEPGAEKVYTNANTNLLGAVVESVTGEAFADVLDERILEPLGQTGTRYIVDAATWTEPHPEGYQPTDAGPEAQDQNFSVLQAAGSMISTLEDTRVWGEVLGSGALLSTESQAARLQGAPLDAGPPYDRYALGIGETDGWWGHNGEGIGFTAAVFHQPETGATIVVFTNESNVLPKAHPADETFRRLAAVLDAETAS